MDNRRILLRYEDVTAVDGVNAVKVSLVYRCTSSSWTRSYEPKGYYVDILPVKLEHLVDRTLEIVMLGTNVYGRVLVQETARFSRSTLENLAKSARVQKITEQVVTKIKQEMQVNSR
jgi:hypothetical protein